MHTPIILLQFYVQVLACCHLHLYGNKLLLDFTEVVLVGSFHRKTFEKVGSLPKVRKQRDFPRVTRLFPGKKRIPTGWRKPAILPSLP